MLSDAARAAMARLSVVQVIRHESKVSDSTSTCMSRTAEKNDGGLSVAHVGFVYTERFGVRSGISLSIRAMRKGGRGEGRGDGEGGRRGERVGEEGEESLSGVKGRKEPETEVGRTECGTDAVPSHDCMR